MGAWLDCSKVYVLPISDVVQKVEHCLFVFLNLSVLILHEWSTNSGLFATVKCNVM